MKHSMRLFSLLPNLAKPKLPAYLAIVYFIDIPNGSLLFGPHYLGWALSKRH